MPYCTKLYVCYGRPEGLNIVERSGVVHQSYSVFSFTSFVRFPASFSRLPVL